VFVSCQFKDKIIIIVVGVGVIRSRNKAIGLFFFFSLVAAAAYYTFDTVPHHLLQLV
jgi:hypothetical protein